MISKIFFRLLELISTLRDPTLMMLEETQTLVSTLPTDQKLFVAVRLIY